MPWLAAGWARYSITAVAFLTGLLAQAMSKKMLQSGWSLYPEMFYNSNSLAQAAWIGAVLMLLLAMWQKGRGWSLARLLTFVAVLTLGCFALVWTPLITPWSWKPREPTEMAKLEANHSPLPPPSTFRFYRSHDEDGKPVLDFDAELASLPAPAELLPRWRMVSGEMRLNDKVIPGKVHNYLSRRWFWMPAVFSRDNAWLMGTLGRSMPSSTLSMDANDIQHGRNADCSWPILSAGTSLVDVDLRLEADWLRQTVLGECELKPGAQISTPEAMLEVLEVRLHQGANGAREKGSVVVIYKGAKRSIECGGNPFEYMTDLGVMLHAPSKELLWQKTDGAGDVDYRAMQGGWQKFRFTLVFKEVIGRGSGLTEADVPSLRVMLRTQTYAGTSRHRLTLKDVDMKKALEEEAWVYPAWHPLVASEPREGLQREFERIRPPAADADAAEVARFLADVLTLSHSLSWRYSSKKDGSPAYPGKDERVVNAVAAHLLRHPHVLPEEGIVDSDPLIWEVMKAMVIQAKVPYITQEAGKLCYKNPNSGLTIPRLLYNDANQADLWKTLRLAILSAIQQRDAAPIVAVHETWQKQARVHQEDAVWLKSLRETFRVSSLWALKGREAALQEARALIKHACEQRLPPTMYLSSELRPLAECAIAMGDAAVLDRRLRGLRRWSEESFDHGNLRELSKLNRLLGGAALKWEEGLPFLRRMRELRAVDFIYDATTLTWRAKTKP